MPFSRFFGRGILSRLLSTDLSFDCVEISMLCSRFLIVTGEVAICSADQKPFRPRICLNVPAAGMWNVKNIYTYTEVIK